ncbi:MAG: ASCH domain-containing protein [Rhizobiaceae bacterium]|nr:ASCH domain-containing protein [Rhizobiaceae bacterium]MCV0404869.1 ASCH domain-containing protein [Rhizobiaceae bacterium]
MKGLIIREPWIDLILDGQKTWELRTQSTSIRGQIALIRKGSRQIDGIAMLVDVLPPLDPSDLEDSFNFHRIPLDRRGAIIEAGWLTPWVLLDAYRFSTPVPFTRPSGPVSWVDLDFESARAAQSAHRPNASPEASPRLSDQRPAVACHQARDISFEAPTPSSARAPQISPALEAKLAFAAEQLGFAVKPRSGQTKMLQFSTGFRHGTLYVFVDRMPKSDPKYRLFLPPDLDGRVAEIVAALPGVERFRNGRSGDFAFRHSAFRVFGGFDGQEPQAYGWMIPSTDGEVPFSRILEAIKAL